MVKMIDASCEAQKVTAEGFEITEAEIESQGDGVSDGLLLIDGDRSRYLTSSAKDLNATLTKLSAVLGNIADGMEAMDTAGYIISVSGGSGAPAVGVPATPFAAGDISSIRSIQSEIDTLRDELR